MGAASEWNWANGSEWAADEATQQWPPAAPRWPTAAQAAAAAPPPWMAATQQPAWPPVSAAAWPPASSSAAPGGIGSMSGPAAGFVGSFAQVPRAPVATQNRFMPLDDQGREHSREVTLADYMIKPKKPRRGRTARPSTCASSGDSKAVLGIQEQGAIPRVPGAPTGSDASAAWTSRPAISSTVTSASPLTLCTSLVPSSCALECRSLSTPVSYTDGSDPVSYTDGSPVTYTDGGCTTPVSNTDGSPVLSDDISTFDNIFD